MSNAGAESFERDGPPRQAFPCVPRAVPELQPVVTFFMRTVVNGPPRSNTMLNVTVSTGMVALPTSGSNSTLALEAGLQFARTTVVRPSRSCGGQEPAEVRLS